MTATARVIFSDKGNIALPDLGVGKGLPNLAGGPERLSSAQCRTELSSAGVPPVEVTEYGEVNSKVAGLLLYPSGVIVKFYRAWYYWQVAASEPLPKTLAGQLNERYGDVVRVEGFAGGKAVEGDGIRSWHVDTDVGLSMLVNTLNAQFGAPLKIEADFCKRTKLLERDE